MNFFEQAQTPKTYWMKLSIVLLSIFFINNSATAQTELWRVTDTTYGLYSINKLVVSTNNNIYIIGYGYHLGNYSAVIIKRSANGTVLWNYKCELFNSPFNLEKAIIDSDENVYLVGSVLLGSSYDGVVIKVDADGNSLWHQSFNPSSGSDNYLSVAVDDLGYIYAVGYSVNPGINDQRVWITKFNSTGTVQWSQFYSAPNKNASGFEVKLDSNGDVIVTGNMYEGSNKWKMLMLKYNSSGTLLWQQESNQTEPYSYYNFKKAITDENNNTYFFAHLDTSTSGGSAQISDKGIVIIKVNESGSIQWSRNYLNSNYSIKTINTCYADDNNVIYFGGTGDSSMVSHGYYAALNSTTGDIIWKKLFRGSSGNGGNVYDIKISGTVLYFTGLYGGLGTSDDYYTAKVNKTDGAVLWSTTYNGFSNSQDVATKIALDNDDNIIVSGSAREYSPFEAKVTTIKYGSLTDISEHNLNEMSLLVYPQPFHSSVTLNIIMPGMSWGNLQLFDITGNLVAEQKKNSFSEGENVISLNLEALNSGVYISHIQTQFGTIRKKIICVK
jgi:outer membrane protein assembly factor BamB